MKRHIHGFWGLMVIACATGLNPAWAENAVVLLSRSLQPYLEAVNGIESTDFYRTRILNMEGNLDTAKQLMKTLALGDADILITVGTEATQVARNYLENVPVVYTMVLGVQEFPNRKSGGVLMQSDLREQLQNIKKLFPQVKNIGVIYNFYYSGTIISQARDVVHELGLGLTPFAVQSLEEVPSAIKKLSETRIDLLWSVVDQTVTQPEAINQQIQFSLSAKIPYIALSRFHVKAGALAAFSVDYRDLGLQTAELAHKMLHQPDYTSVETPRRQILIVNEKTQKLMGIAPFPELPGLLLEKQ